MAFLDGTVVNVALPSISDDLGTSVTGLQWVVNAYLVTLSALLLLGGTLGDRYGHRNVFVAGAVIFTAASVLCGLAPTSQFLIAARAVQGAGGNGNQGSQCDGPAERRCDFQRHASPEGGV